MKGVILTAGNAKRLKPITNAYGKVLVPIYNKPMIDYGVSLFIASGIRDIVLVCSKPDLPIYKKLYKKFIGQGVNIDFKIQKVAKGTANALKYASGFVNGDDFVLLFGDNIFISNNMSAMLKEAIKNNKGLTMFAKGFSDPERFGVIEHDKNYLITNMEEKPKQPKTNLAVIGLYVFKGDAMKRLKDVKLSERGEYELTDVIQQYIAENNAMVKVLDDNTKWLDTGTHESLLECSEIVREFEKTNGLIVCIELELYKQKLINKNQLEELISGYGADYIKQVLRQTLPL